MEDTETKRRLVGLGELPPDGIGSVNGDAEDDDDNAWVVHPVFIQGGRLLLLSHSSRVLDDPIDGSPPGSTHHPWDSPGKNTGVGCHFLLQCRKVKSESEVAQSYLTL